ncbi:MAG: iron ABC transporter permease [Limnohabitans sp.]|nr:iron ABC transporter permease [Limnohabitans sp.]
MTARAMLPRFFLLSLVLCCAALVRVALGPIGTDEGVRLVLGVPSADIAQLRVLSVVSAALVGAALGLSGLALQVLMRNPLASPFVLGISSGAGFGVACVLVLGALGAFSSRIFFGEAIGAILGAACTLGIVARLGRATDGQDTTALLLAGVILGSMFSAGTMLLEHLVPHGLRGDLLSWMSGRLPEIPNRAQLATLAVVTVLAWIVLARASKALDVSMLSDDEARSSGVALHALRRKLFWTGGVLAGVAVAYAGPIGFVGLVGPHIARRLLGPHHGLLVPGSALAGALLLVSADAVRQVLDLGSGRLPVGVVTALAGGPAFLWLLRRGSGR